MFEALAVAFVILWMPLGAVMCLYTKRWEDFFVWPIIVVKRVWRRAVQVWKE